MLKLMPNAGPQLLLEAGAERTLERRQLQALVIRLPHVPEVDGELRFNSLEA